jgi:protocatechuate 3,4-dioxygenase beta subunit
MRTPALALLVLLLVALGAALWWSATTGGDATGVDDPATRPGTGVTALVPGPTDDDRAAATRRVADASADLGPIDRQRDLHGLVTGPGGAPLAGAEVTASASVAEGYSLLDRPLRGDRRQAGTTTTGPDGRYRLRLEPGRPFLVRARAPGLAPAARSGCLAGARVDFALRHGATLTGTVRRALGNDIVPGTRIVVRSLALEGSAGSAEADAVGNYRIDGLPAGTCEVDVLPATLASPRDFEVELRAGAVTVHDILLTEGLTIRGRVLDAGTRAGIAGALVGEGVAGRSVRTASDGAFELVGFAPLSNISLRVHADGYADAEPMLRGRGSTPADTRTEIEILLRKGRTARGVVHDPQGVPKPGVYVAAAAADHRGEGDFFRSDWRSTFTKADGAFVIADLRPDMQHSLLLLHKGFATLVYEFPADEERRSDVDFGALRLQPPASLAGIVRDEFGQPVADHVVELDGHNKDRWRLRAPATDGYRALDGYVANRACRTDDLGRFAFPDVAAGDYRVSAQKFDSHEQASVRSVVEPGEAVTGVTLVLARGLAITGSVFVGDGGPLPKCYCSIDPEDGQATSGDVEVRADGTFHAGGLAGGNYTITVYPYASEADRALGRTFQSSVHARVGAGTAGVRCEVPVMRPVRGTLVDPLRAPVAGAWVAVLDGEKVVASALTDAQGAFAIPAPVGRTVRVLACAPLALPPGSKSAFARERVVAQRDAIAGGDPVELTVPSR